MRFARIAFLVAGIYGLLTLAPLYFMENAIGQKSPPPITHPEYFYGFLGTAIAWQFLFLVLSTNPERYRAMILPSIVEKASFAIALVILHMQRRIADSTLVLGSIDWIWAFLFLVSYFKTKRGPAAA